jgi:hypothetical protein
MHRIAVWSAGALGAVALFAPLITFAQMIDFGGRILSINYCLHGAVNIIILPAGGFPISYVWSFPPATFTATEPFTPPFHIGQQVLGESLPVAIPCIGFGTHPPVWWGFQAIYGGYDI